MISTVRLLELVGRKPHCMISSGWQDRLVALRARSEALDVPALLAAWQQQGGTWAELFVLYKALIAAGDLPDVGLWQRIAETTGDSWIAGKVPWVQELPVPGDEMRLVTVDRAEAFVLDAAAVQATPAYWSAGPEAYRAAYVRAASTYLGMLMDAMGEPIQEVPVPAPDYLYLRVITLPRPPYAGLWEGLYPCYVRVSRFEAWAKVDVDPATVQAFVLRDTLKRSVYAFRADRDVPFAWAENNRVQERFSIPAGVLWRAFDVDPSSDEVIAIESLTPCPTPGAEPLLDSNYRW